MAKRILVPLDQSTLAETVLPLVDDLARGEGAVVRLLYVAPAPQTRVGEDGLVVAYADQEMQRLEAEGRDYLTKAEVQLGGVPVECVVRFGDPLAEILSEAAAFEADLITVTTAGRSGLSRAIMGSVAEQVMRKAEVPVLLLRPGRNGLA
jgi:nucleotide-binding universal stress UspA family protein